MKTDSMKRDNSEIDLGEEYIQMYYDLSEVRKLRQFINLIRHYTDLFSSFPTNHIHIIRLLNRISSLKLIVFLTQSAIPRGVYYRTQRVLLRMRVHH